MFWSVEAQHVSAASACRWEVGVLSTGPKTTEVGKNYTYLRRDG